MHKDHLCLELIFFFGVGAKKKRLSERSNEDWIHSKPVLKQQQTSNCSKAKIIIYEHTGSTWVEILSYEMFEKKPIFFK